MQSVSPSTSVSISKRGLLSKIKAAWARAEQPANGHLYFGVYLEDGQVTIPKAIWWSQQLLEPFVQARTALHRASLLRLFISFSHSKINFLELLLR